MTRYEGFLPSSHRDLKGPRRPTCTVPTRAALVVLDPTSVVGQQLGATRGSGFSMPLQREPGGLLKQ
jgi:hypothetical protein